MVVLYYCSTASNHTEGLVNKFRGVGLSRSKTDKAKLHDPPLCKGIKFTDPPPFPGSKLHDIPNPKMSHGCYFKAIFCMKVTI